MRQIPAREGNGEHEDRGSRFLAWVFPATSVEAFEQRLAELYEEHPKARHHCWAWRIGAAYRFQDDGEPGGTAGRPMLQVLEGAGLDDVGAICVRYFGGVKLGTGGLTRAYGGATTRATQEAGVQIVVPRVVRVLHLPFSHLGVRDEITSLFPQAILMGDYTEDGWRGQVDLEEQDWPRLRGLLEERGGGTNLFDSMPSEC